MNFKYKCLLQQFFSHVPKGELLNYWFQKHVTKSLPPDQISFVEKVTAAVDHHDNYLAFNQLSTKTGRYYEFGAGWTLTIPLTMSLLGLDVYCSDLRKLLLPEMIQDTLNKFWLYQNHLPLELSKPLSTIDARNVIQDLAQHYQLHYMAPADARNMDFDDESFDFISSSVTLEHIPKNDIHPILMECYRILSKGGVFSIKIDSQDHWSYFDTNISKYHFLKYSSNAWKKYNPSLHFQNRLRHSDYMKLITQTDFEIAKVEPQLPNENDMEVINSIKIANEFESYDKTDLAIKGAEIVLVK